MKKRKFIFIILISGIVYSCSTARFAYLAEPEHKADSTYINHYAYSLCYDEGMEQAKWVAYDLKESDLVANCKRKDCFIPDTMVSSQTAGDRDYKSNGYDRGHLAPAGDMLRNKIAMRESFYYSNISPQLPSFNRGIWKKLEMKIREWVNRYGRLYIICGPVFSDSDNTIGENSVAVADYFFKTILVDNPKEKFCIGFLFPHIKCEGDIFNYAVTVDSVENVTGLDLYHKLPNRMEKDIESKYSIATWK